MYLLVYQLDKLIRQLARHVRQAPDPVGAAHWCLQELAGRTGLRVLMLDPSCTPSERLTAAGSEVLDALRDGLAQEDTQATLEAAKALMGNLGEELTAYEMGEDWDGTTGVTVSTLTRAWGEQAPRCHR